MTICPKQSLRTRKLGQIGHTASLQRPYAHKTQDSVGIIADYSFSMPNPGNLSEKNNRNWAYASRKRRSMPKRKFEKWRLRLDWA